MSQDATNKNHTSTSSTTSSGNDNIVDLSMDVDDFQDDNDDDTPSPPLLRLTRHKPSSSVPPTMNKNNKQRPPLASSSSSSIQQTIWEQRLREAAFECQVDPYRGMCCNNNNSNNTTATATANWTASPWVQSCCTGIPIKDVPDSSPGDNSNDHNNHDNNDVDDEVAEIVQFVSNGSTCPSLTKWTREAKKKMDTKRKRKHNNKQQQAATVVVVVGQRPPLTEELCVCDFNPFCMVTLGGAMNDVLLERATVLHQAKYENDNDNANAPPKNYSNTAAAGEKNHDNDKNEDEMNDATNNNDNDNTTLELKTNVSKTIILSEPTQLLLDSLRRSTYLDTTTNGMQQHLKQLLEGWIPIPEAIESFAMYQKQLVFANPLSPPQNEKPASFNDNQNNNNNHILMAVPPGIRNLGATCYLNTQLQCLAQNLVFIRGIFQWRPPSTTTQQNDRMSSVISLFQKLLAQLREGSKNVCCAREWTTALGLDHGEQQDPNEFSRLLFARMAESFQAQTVASQEEEEEEEEDNNHNNHLATLLTDLFQGAIVYETTCSKCARVSKRKEEFEDLNLPIVKPPVAVADKGKGLLAFFSSTSSKETDTDVQYCLEKYCEEELLEGDNQYFCSACNQKQDATRKPTFQKLPSCLNIQLCRYIYDRSSGEKKKLSEKVLLPKELNVSSSDRHGEKHNRYLLCAVMRHKGTSAYRGHYVAEAMDWVSGQWFEFNDETVTVLADGPTCSYGPSDKQDTGTKSGKAAKKLAGSNEAYNMYYVEESFLAQSVMESLRDGTASLTNNETTEKPNILDQIRMDRQKEYTDLETQCQEEIATLSKLEKRRDALRLLFNDLKPLAQGEPAICVDGEKLRKYVSCAPMQSKDQDCNVSALLVDSCHFCEHQRIHPRYARRCKLLPRAFFDRLVTICGLVEDVDDDSSLSTLSPDQIACRDCSEMYALELHYKLDLARKQKALDDELRLAAAHSWQFYSPDSPPEEDADRYAYAVSKEFIKFFRGHVTRLVKTVGNADMTRVPADAASDAEFYCEGFDALDMALLSLDSSDAAIVDAEENNVLSVNKNITCPHGNCNTGRKGPVIFVPWNTWEMISDLFPSAMCHKTKRIAASEKSAVEVDDLICSICRDSSATDKQKKLRLQHIAKSLSKAYRSFESYSLNDLKCCLSTLPADEFFLILHESDYKSWKKLATTIQRSDPINGESLESFIKRSLHLPFLPSTGWTPHLLPRHVSSNLADKERMDLVISLFHPILCRHHGVPLHEALFAEIGSPHLGNHLTFMKPSQYNELLNHVVAMSYVILPPSENLEEPSDRDGNLDLHDAVQFVDTLELVGDVHPKFQPCSLGEESTCVSCVCCSKTDLFVKACVDKVCSIEYNDWIEENEKLWDKKVEHLDRSIGQLKSTSTDAIILDSDEDSGRKRKGTAKSFNLRVFEAVAHSQTEDILAAMEQCTAWGNDESKVDNFAVRRSTRKKKTRYPVGAFVEEDTMEMSLDNNIAALRLCLFERCTNGSSFDLNHDLVLVVRKQSPPQVFDLDEDQSNNAGDEELEDLNAVIPLPFDRNHESLLDICLDLLGGESAVNSPSFDPSESVFLVRMSQVDESSRDFSKDTLMDHLIDISSASTGPTNDKPANKRRKRATERGFSGTLLSSSAPAAAPSDQDNEDKTTPDSESTPMLLYDNEKVKSRALTVDLTNGNTNDHQVFHVGLVDSWDHESASASVKIVQPLMEERRSRRPDLKTAHARENNTYRSSSDDVDDDNVSDDDDDDDDSLDGLMGVTVPNSSPSKTRNTEHDADLSFRIAAMLMENPDIDDEAASFEAATWSVKKHSGKPIVDEAFLLNAAYAKYLELRSTVRVR